MADHEWVALARFIITEAEVRMSLEGSVKAVPLGAHNLVSIQMGCFVCEEQASLDLLGEPCPGEP